MFNAPESVVYDAPRARYLVSNAGDGRLIEVAEDGTQRLLNDSQTSCRGLHIVENTLYAACDAGVAAIDLATGQTNAVMAIKDRAFLNDVTADTSGHLYVSDTQAGVLFQITLSDQSTTPFVDGLDRPNGLLFDEAENRLILCSFRANAPIQAVDLSDDSVSTITATTLSDLDGLASDLDGNVYVSSWGSGAVHRFDSAFSVPPEVVSEGHDGPADIFFDPHTHLLAIPNFNTNTLDVVVVTAPPAVVLLTPEAEATDQPTTLTLTWDAQPAAASYQIQVATVSDFSSLVHEESGRVETSVEVGPLAAGVTHHWRVRAVNEHGQGPWSEARSFTTQVTTAIDPADAELPATFTLHAAYPNPFNPQTLIPYDVPAPSRVHLTVHDVLGCRVATLMDERQPAGKHQRVWDAGDLASGVYLIRLVATGPSGQRFTAVRKAVLLR